MGYNSVAQWGSTTIYLFSVLGMKNSSNYIHWTPLITTLIVVVMSVLSLLPPFDFFDMRLKQANIYSGVVSDSLIRELFGLRYITLEGESLLPPAELLDSVSQPLIATPLNTSASLEDYSPEGDMLESLRQRLEASPKEPLRIAFIGDSFIEGDILTMDLREMLQSHFCGGGVGFVPITSVVAKYRGTVKHTFSDDWRSACITRNRDAAQRYTLSGYEFYPQEGSWVEYGRTYFRQGAQQINRATLLFVNPEYAKISVEVNGKPYETVEVGSSTDLQEYTIDEPIEKIRYSFSDCEGLILYGVLLDYVDAELAGGVSLDNYSIRGNSGIFMTHIDRDLSAQMDAIAPYSLIVVQYGVNVSGQDNYSYAKYGNQLLSVVNHIKKCYPSSAIMLLGVSDRCVVVDGEAVTMPSIVALDNIERQVAQSSGVLYYSTLQAMREMGGMGYFVEQNWAYKDFTHINTIGGMRVAEKLYNALTLE